MPGYHHEENISNISVLQTNYRSSLRHGASKGVKVTDIKAHSSGMYQAGISK